MVTRTRVLMGTLASVTLPKKESVLIDEVFDTLFDIEGALSTFNKHASLARLNRYHRIPYDAILADALRLSRRFYDETNGYFDVTIGSVTKKLYRFGDSDPASPAKEDLQRAVLNIDGFTVSRQSIASDANITIDLGGMGKGYAVDRAARLLKQKGVDKGIVALSGDIRCLHRCVVGIQSPFDEEAVVAVLRAKTDGLSISTSGTYRRYGVRRSEHHLIDPKRVTQANAFVSVTLVTHANNARIDAYATAVSVMPEKKALDFLASLKDIGYLVIKPDGSVVWGNLKPFAEGVIPKYVLRDENASLHTFHRPKPNRSDQSDTQIGTKTKAKSIK